MDIKAQNDKRVKLLLEMRKILTVASDAGRDVTPDEQTKYDSMEKDVAVLDTNVQNHRTLKKLEDDARKTNDSSYEAQLRTLADTKDKNGRPARKVDTPEYRDALNQYARSGENGMAPEIKAALQVGTAAAGGFLVPTEFETELIRLLVNLDPVRANAKVIRTASERAIPIEVSKAVFAYMAENGAYPVVQPGFGQEVLGAFKSGGIIPISEELLQDSFFDLTAYLQEAAADSWNNLEEINFATGDGINKPKGIMATDAVAGVALSNVLGTASGAITANNFVDTYHSLARRYRQNASWLMSDNTVKAVRKIVTGLSGDTTYIWQPGLTQDRPDTILGRPVLVSGGVADAASQARSVGFGDLSKYYIGERVGVSVQRLVELYAANGQVGFRFWRRNDARLVDPKAWAYFTHGT